MNAAAVAAAYGLDLVAKDPHFTLHPVRLIGNFIGLQEKLWRRLVVNELAGGFLLSVCTVFTVFGVSWVLTAVCGEVHPALGITAHAALIYFTISPSALADEGTALLHLLTGGNETDARKRLSMIVGRDTAFLGRGGIIRACVETMAENSVDAVISPLFFAVIGGGPLAMAYRAVNTCDSMIGYRGARYEYFGKCSAKLDDAANFIPARIALIIIPAAAWLVRLNAAESLTTGFRDRLKHASPNSAHGEAAFAGALGIRLGGPSSYGGEMEMKPWLGSGTREPEPADLRSAARLLHAVSALSVLVALSFLYIV